MRKAEEDEVSLDKSQKSQITNLPQDQESNTASLKKVGKKGKAKTGFESEDDEDPTKKKGEGEQN